MLDRETLSVVVSMVAQVTLLVMYTIWRINRQVPGLRWWMAASATMSLGFLAIPLAQGVGWPFSGALIVNQAAALATRWVLACLAPDDQGIQQHPFQGVLYLALVLFIVGWTYSISLACYQQAQSRVLALAREDALTALPNRRYFDEALDREVARCERSHQSFGLVLADLNGFKQVNDRFGHGAGDAVLIEVARRLRELARSGDFVARLGGDEFVILIHDLTSFGTGEQAVQRLRKVVNGPFQLPGGNRVDIEVSLGLACWPQDAAQPGDLVKVADLRMYAEKALLKAQRGLARTQPPGA